MPGSGRVLRQKKDYGLSDESQIAEKHSRVTVMTSVSRALQVDAVWDKF